MCALWLALAGAMTPRFGQEQQYDVKANYTKSEHMIAMRDGVKLFTVVYAPKDTSRSYPIMLNRTPYSVGPYGADQYRGAGGLGPSIHFVQEGYIFAHQDVRGRFMSEGTYMDVRPHKPKKSGPTDIDESTDTYDTIEWLVKNIPNNTGRVGMWGISYPGFYSAMGLLDAHPALKAASPQAPIADWFIGDDFHHNGTFFLNHAFNFYSSFGRPRPRPTPQPPPRFNHGTPDAYSFFLDMGPLANANTKYFKNELAFWNEMMNHPNYDEFWQARSTLQHFKNIRPAVMTVGGWFDAEDLYGALQTYKAIEKNNPGTYNILVMGPWFHGGWAGGDGEKLGDINFGSKTSPFYRENIELAFFNHFLKDKGELKLPEAYLFETGSNEWNRLDQWPPRGARPEQVYLQANGKLALAPPAVAPAVAFDEYVSDPRKPVPYINNTALGMTIQYMVADQRFAATRPDVLVYQTDVLTEDLTVAGPIIASLFVSSTGTDSDFVVKIIDVYPNDAPNPSPNPTNVRMGGYQMMVRGEPMRARFRNSFTYPLPLVPGKVEKVEFELPDVFHTFQKGHRLMVQIQSSWFPLVDMNPQRYVDIYKATAADFQKATQRIYRSGKYPSHIRLSVAR
jgi:putative CocE/NonD family hydrolase